MTITENRLSDHALSTFRAVQLAIVHLTRRDDVAVIQEPQDYGVDLLVSLQEDGRNVGRLLAVQVKAVRSTMSLSRVGHDSGPADASFSAFRFPLCLFVFSMEDDQGYWRWLRRPVSDASANRRLTTEQDETLHRLTDQTIDQILNAIRDWYDA